MMSSDRTMSRTMATSRSHTMTGMAMMTRGMMTRGMMMTSHMSTSSLTTTTVSEKFAPHTPSHVRHTLRKAVWSLVAEVETGILVETGVYTPVHAAATATTSSSAWTQSMSMSGRMMSMSGRMEGGGHTMCVNVVLVMEALGGDGDVKLVESAAGKAVEGFQWDKVNVHVTSIPSVYVGNTCTSSDLLMYSHRHHHHHHHHHHRHRHHRVDPVDICTAGEEKEAKEGAKMLFDASGCDGGVLTRMAACELQCINMKCQKWVFSTSNSLCNVITDDSDGIDVALECDVAPCVVFDRVSTSPCSDTTTTESQAIVRATTSFAGGDGTAVCAEQRRSCFSNDGCSRAVAILARPSRSRQSWAEVDVMMDAMARGRTSMAVGAQAALRMNAWSDCMAKVASEHGVAVCPWAVPPSGSPCGVGYRGVEGVSVCGYGRKCCECASGDTPVCANSSTAVCEGGVWNVRRTELSCMACGRCGSGRWRWHGTSVVFNTSQWSGLHVQGCDFSKQGAVQGITTITSVACPSLSASDNSVSPQEYACREVCATASECLAWTTSASGECHLYADVSCAASGCVCDGCVCRSGECLRGVATSGSSSGSGSGSGNGSTWPNYMSGYGDPQCARHTTTVSSTAASQCHHTCTAGRLCTAVAGGRACVACRACHHAVVTQRKEGGLETVECVRNNSTCEAEGGRGEVGEGAALRAWTLPSASVVSAGALMAAAVLAGIVGGARSWRQRGGSLRIQPHQPRPHTPGGSTVGGREATDAVKEGGGGGDAPWHGWRRDRSARGEGGQTHVELTAVKALGSDSAIPRVKVLQGPSRDAGNRRRGSRLLLSLGSSSLLGEHATGSDRGEAVRGRKYYTGTM